MAVWHQAAAQMLHECRVSTWQLPLRLHFGPSGTNTQQCHLLFISTTVCLGIHYIGVACGGSACMASLQQEPMMQGQQSQKYTPDLIWQKLDEACLCCAQGSCSNSCLTCKQMQFGSSSAAQLQAESGRLASSSELRAEDMHMLEQKVDLLEEDQRSTELQMQSLNQQLALTEEAKRGLHIR